MFSFLWPRTSHSSQPPPLKDDPTVCPSRTVCPSHPVSDPHHHSQYELLRSELYHGPFDVAPADMASLFDILLFDVDEKVLHDEISTTLGSAYLSETPHLTSPHAAVDGILFGEYDRTLFPLVVKVSKSRSYIIHFLFDSGSPFTFLSREVCGVLEPKHFTCKY